MNKTLLICSFTLLTAFGAIGCAKKDPAPEVASSAQEGSGRFGSGSAPAEATANLIGPWEGKAQFDNTSAVSRGKVELELKEGNKFSMRLMAVPMEGSFSVAQQVLTLTPEKAFGKTMAELEKLEPKNAKAVRDRFSPMDIKIDEDGKSMVMTDPKDSGARLVFKRPEPKTVARVSVTPAEQKLVGSYGVKIDESELKKLSPDQRALSGPIMESMKLELRADNSFDLSMFGDASGLWSVEGGKLILKPEAVMGQAQQNMKEVEMTIKDGTLSLVDKGQRMPFTFTKK